MRRANLIVEEGLEEGKDLALQLRCIVPPPPNILHLVFRVWGQGPWVYAVDRGDSPWCRVGRLHMLLGEGRGGEKAGIERAHSMRAWEMVLWLTGKNTSMSWFSGMFASSSLTWASPAARRSLLTFLGCGASTAAALSPNPTARFAGNAMAMNWTYAHKPPLTPLLLLLPVLPSPPIPPLDSSLSPR